VTDENEAPDRYAVPALAVHCGLERYNADVDEWERLEIPTVGKWWRPAERHPRKLAEDFWLDGVLADGQYRPVWAPKDRRRTLPDAVAFVLDEPSSEEWIGDEEEDDEQEGEEEQPEPADPVRVLPKVPPPPRPPTNGARAPGAVPGRTTPLRRGPQPPPRPDPSPTHPLLHRHEQGQADTPVSTFMFINSTIEAERERAHQRTMALQEYLIASVNARADLAIASERERSNQMLAFIQATAESSRRSELAPIEARIAALSDDFVRVQDDVEADAQERIAEQMKAMTQQPDGPQALVTAIGSFMQSPGGELIATGLRKLLGRDDEPAQLPQGPYDPAG